MKPLLSKEEIADLLVANSGSNSVSVLPGNGDGSFEREQRIGAGDGPFALALRI